MSDNVFDLGTVNTGNLQDRVWSDSGIGSIMVEEKNGSLVAAFCTFAFPHLEYSGSTARQISEDLVEVCNKASSGIMTVNIEVDNLGVVELVDNSAGELKPSRSRSTGDTSKLLKLYSLHHNNKYIPSDPEHLSFTVNQMFDLAKILYLSALRIEQRENE